MKSMTNRVKALHDKVVHDEATDRAIAQAVGELKVWVP